MPKPKDLTLAVLREIRDELRSTREDVARRIDGTNSRLDKTNARLQSMDARLESLDTRLGRVELDVSGLTGGFAELAQQQRFVVASIRGMAARDARFDAELAELRARVEALETHLPR